MEDALREMIRWAGMPSTSDYEAFSVRLTDCYLDDNGVVDEDLLGPIPTASTDMSNMFEALLLVNAGARYPKRDIWRTKNGDLTWVSFVMEEIYDTESAPQKWDRLLDEICEGRKPIAYDEWQQIVRNIHDQPLPKYEKKTRREEWLWLMVDQRFDPHSLLTRNRQLGVAGHDDPPRARNRGTSVRRMGLPVPPRDFRYIPRRVPRKDSWMTHLPKEHWTNPWNVDDWKSCSAINQLAVATMWEDLEIKLVF